MLFSREDVATFINANFEASWEMVRPVPIVRIDFGNGNVATRTLHGNIATHVCSANGEIVDVLPGMYTPPAYRAALGRIRQVTVSLPPAPGPRQERLHDYHRIQAQTLHNRPQQIVYAPQRPVDPGKSRIELRVEQLVILTPPAHDGRAALPPDRRNLAQWELLAADTWRNETERRLQIHERLADAEPFRPEQLKRWLYREVLHADLADPYLGLGDVLFGDDVFRDER